jgi:hypothetical protein
MSKYNNPQRQRVGHMIWEIQRSLRVFDYGDFQYLSPALADALCEAEEAFHQEDYAQAEHLTKVVAYLIKREAPKFKANPRGCIERYSEQQTYHKRKPRTDNREAANG